MITYFEVEPPARV